MKKVSLIVSLAAAAIIGFSSCEKVKEEVAEQAATQTPTPPSATPPSPDAFNTKGIDGVLVAIEAKTEMNVSGVPFSFKIGTAVSYFANTTGDFSTFVDAGSVSCNNKALTIQDNKSYVFMNSNDDVKGIEFKGSAAWDVAGKGNVKAFKYTNSGFPSSPTVPGSQECTAGSDFTFAASGLSSADTVLFTISSGNGTITKGAAAKSGTVEVKFTGAETGKLEKSDGKALFQVAAVKFNPFKNTNDTSKTYLGINESVTNVLGTVK